MKVVTDEIKQALTRYFEDQATSASTLSAKLVLAKSTVPRWMSGHTTRISDSVWVNLRVLLDPYLRAKRPGAGHSRATLPHTSTGQHDATCVSDGELVAVPILGNAAAAGYEPAVEPLSDWLEAFGDESENWAAEDVGPGYFCLRMEGNSMAPQFPDGTILLVAGGEFPQRGDVVVARLADHGEVVVKRYGRKDNLVRLDSENPAGQSYAIDLKAEPGRLVWMWPVVQAKINLRKQRWEHQKRP